MKTREPWEIALLIGTLVAVVVGSLFVSLAPLPVVAAAGFGLVLLWALFWKRPTVYRLTAWLSVLVATVVPVTRLPGEHATFRVLAVGLLLYAIFALVVRCKGLPPRQIVLPLLVLFGSLAASTAYSFDDNKWLIFGLQAVASIAGICVAVAGHKLSRLQTLWRVFVAVGIFQAAYGVYEMVNAPEPLWQGAVIALDGTSFAMRHDLISGFQRAQGSFGHPLPFAFYLTLAALVLLHLMKAGRAVKLMGWLVLAAGAFASGSRSAILLFLFVSVVGYAKKWMVIAAPFLVLGGIAALALTWTTLVEQADQLVGSGSWWHRTAALRAIPHLLQDRPFGQIMFGDGAGSTPRLYRSGLLQADGLQAVDNQYVHTLAEAGVFGLAALVFITIAAFARSRGGVRLAVVAVALQLMIFDALAWPSMAFVSWIILALGLLGHGSKPKSEDAAELKKPALPPKRSNAYANIGGRRA